MPTADTEPPEMSGDHQVLSPKSRFSGDLKTVVVILMSLTAAVWTVGKYVHAIDNRFAAHDQLLGILRKEVDAEGERRAAKEAKPPVTKRWLVTCPREALKGKGDVTCVAIPVRAGTE